MGYIVLQLLYTVYLLSKPYQEKFDQRLQTAGEIFLLSCGYIMLFVNNDSDIFVIAYVGLVTAVAVIMLLK